MNPEPDREDITNLATRAAEQLAHDPRVQLVYLFGSAAERAHARPRDVDLAVWTDSRGRLDKLRRARDLALRRADMAGAGISVAGHQVDTFLFEPDTNRYLGRLCSFSQCPKGKPDCAAPGCGAVAFNKCIPGFEPHADLLAPARIAMLYERTAGRPRRALDLPSTPYGDFGGS